MKLTLLGIVAMIAVILLASLLVADRRKPKRTLESYGDC